ncbi:OmpA family protein [Nitriliruptoraceae bacterium ZYF776]|nr:OmpA family protein [Profundirhabdus halotolerans]
MRRLHLATAAGASVLALALAWPAAAQVEPLQGDVPPADLSAFILPIEATIVDLDGGTRTTESTTEVTISLEADVFFDFDESALLADARAELDEVADQLAEAGVDAVAIGGHTDSVGDDDYNQRLSEERAAAVEAHLAERLGDVRFEVEGFGATQPIAANETDDGEDYPEGRALNRRVEIRYVP